MLIVPPKEHMHVLSSLSAGRPPSRIVLVPGAQGAATIGVHACGVRTPEAAAVAEATAGLAIELHMPKPLIFLYGTQSMMEATHCSMEIMAQGGTNKVQGTVPKEQTNCAPPVTRNPISKTCQADNVCCYYLIGLIKQRFPWERAIELASRRARSWGSTAPTRTLKSSRPSSPSSFTTVTA